MKPKLTPVQDGHGAVRVWRSPRGLHAYIRIRNKKAAMHLVAHWQDVPYAANASQWPTVDNLQAGYTWCLSKPRSSEAMNSTQVRAYLDQVSSKIQAIIQSLNPIVLEERFRISP